jgi:hypothetical protein
MKFEEIILDINKKSKSLDLLFAVRTGLEPATPCVTGRYSNQLNYHTIVCIAIALNCCAKILQFSVLTRISIKIFTA